MKTTIPLVSLLTLPAFSAVVSLPTAPTGYVWQLVTSGQTDSQVVNTSAVESSLEASLGLTGPGATAPYTVTGSGSATADLTAFGSPEPASYALGDTVDLVTANTYAASLDFSNTVAVQNGNPGDFLLVESKLSGVTITSSLGATASGSDLVVAAGDGPVIVVSPNASAAVSDGGSFGQVEGETITFTFTAADEVAVSTFGTGPNASPLIGNPTVNPTLRRDTTYDTYELVEVVPEPSSLSLVALTALGLMGRRRRA